MVCGLIIMSTRYLLLGYKGFQEYISGQVVPKHAHLLLQPKPTINKQRTIYTYKLCSTGMRLAG